MTNNRTILITGVTGKQGGAVAKALQGTGFHLRGLTRTPDSQRAAALARNGIDIVKGDLDDEATLRPALIGAWGVFSVQNAGEAGDCWKRGTIRPDVATVYALQDVGQAWKDIAANLPGVHGMAPSRPGAARRNSHGKIVLRVA